MTTIAKFICVAAVCAISLTGCTNRYQNPYSYNNGLIPPPGTGAYGYNNQAAAPYYQPNQNYQPNQYYQAYQTPPPVGYGQQNVSSNVAPYQNWQTGGNVNVASTQPTLQPMLQQEFQVAPANYEESYPPEAYGQPAMPEPQFQPPAQMNFDNGYNEGGYDDSGYNDQQGSLNQMHINRPDMNIDRSQAVMVPLNSPETNQNLVAANFNGQSQARFVPIDPGAIVLPQSNGYQPNYVPAYEPTTSPGTAVGTSVARNSTLAGHDPQWQGFR